MPTLKKAHPAGRPAVAVSAGDPAGVGPEVTALAIADPGIRESCRPVVFWPRGVVPPGGAEVVRCGRAGDGPGALAMSCLEEAALAVEAGRCVALATAPVSKERASVACRGFTGHTDWLAERAGIDTRGVLMIFHGERSLTACVTRHVPLRLVGRRLDSRGIARAALLLWNHARRCRGARRPRIAVCGMNPHASEGGLIGREDLEIVRPGVAMAVGILARLGLAGEISGPLAADGAFREHLAGRWDAVLAMYHDQATIAAKVADPFRSVNVTAGLPYVRTSPDHGTADAIAGRGVADPGSMIAAILLASRLAARSDRVREGERALLDALG